MNIIKSFTALAAACMLSMVACEEHGVLPEDNTTPVFPEEMVTRNVAAGESVGVTFEANMKWKASISGEGRGSSFWIDDDGMKKTQVSGKAGEQTVVIKFDDKEDFNTVVCEVTLTMGDETRKIAVLTRGPRGRSLSVFAGVPAEYGFEKANSEYVYGTSSVSELTLVTFPEDVTYTLPVKVEADYAWKLAVPEWISVEILSPEGTSGSNVIEGQPGATELMLSAVLFQEEAAGAEDVLRFLDATTLEQHSEIGVVLPSFNDRLEFNINSLRFSKGAQVLMPSGSYSEEPMPAIAYVLATEGSVVRTFEVVDGKHSVEAADWVTLTTGFDPEGGLLQNYPVEVSVSVNEDVERYADLFAFPETAASLTAADIYSSEDAESIKDEYQGYYIGRIVQEGIIPPYIIPLSTEELMLEVGTYYMVLDPTAEENVMQWDFPAAPSYHRFIYTTPYSSEEASFEIYSPYEKCVLYKDMEYPDGLFSDKVGEDEDYWLEFVPFADNTKGRFNILKVPSESVQTAAVFYDGNDNILGCVLIRYDAASSGKDELVLELAEGEAALVKLGEESEIYQAFSVEYSVTEVYELTTSDAAVMLFASETPADVMINQAVAPFPEYASCPFKVEYAESVILIDNAEVEEDVMAVIVLKDENMLNRAVIYYHFDYVPAETPGGGEEPDPDQPGGEEPDPDQPGGGEEPNPDPEPEPEPEPEPDVPVEVDPAEIFKLSSGAAEIVKLDGQSDLLKKVYAKYATTQVYQVTTMSRMTTIVLDAAYEIYGGMKLDAGTLEESAGGKASMEPMDNNVVMYSGGAVSREEALYVLLDADDAAIAAIHYVFDPEANIELKPAFEFVYPDKVKGAELSRYEGEELQALLEEFQGVETYNVYKLVYTVASPSRTHLKVPSMPATGYAWGNEEGATDYWLTYTQSSGNIVIKMTQAGLTDKFLFKTSDGMFSHILICTYEPAN